MICVLGHKVEERLDKTPKATIYRGHLEHGGPPVTLEVLRTDYARTADIARFKHEYKLIMGIESPRVIRFYGIEEHADGLIIIAESFAGKDLASILAARG